MRHMRTQLREVSPVRVVGFADAVRDLGTHKICGYDVFYSQQMVRNVLKGVNQSPRLVVKIIEKRPDLLELRCASDDVKALARTLGWVPAGERESGRTQFDRQGCGAAEAARSDTEARPGRDGEAPEGEGRE